jgi:hypothetical protein
MPTSHFDSLLRGHLDVIVSQHTHDDTDSEDAPSRAMARWCVEIGVLEIGFGIAGGCAAVSAAAAGDQEADTDSRDYPRSVTPDVLCCWAFHLPPMLDYTGAAAGIAVGSSTDIVTTLSLGAKAEGWRKTVATCKVGRV